jgi:hypothetical protein
VTAGRPSQVPGCGATAARRCGNGRAGSGSPSRDRRPFPSSAAPASTLPTAPSWRPSGESHPAGAPGCGRGLGATPRAGRSRALGAASAAAGTRARHAAPRGDRVLAAALLPVPLRPGGPSPPGVGRPGAAGRGRVRAFVTRHPRPLSGGCGRQGSDTLGLRDADADGENHQTWMALARKSQKPGETLQNAYLRIRKQAGAK